MILLNPKGLVAADEKTIMMTAVYLMLIVVIPVIVLTLVFAWRYRASNTQATYRPEWSHSTVIEIICWSIPAIIIVILGTLTWTSSHTLDPYRPLPIGTNQGDPEIIQVISLDWKWLFIYPKEQIASVNFVQFPVNKQVKFLITSEAAMNSFIIPQIAGQIYAMAGMQATLHAIANTTGDYLGFSANFSGAGFSEMHFTARVSSQQEFDRWVNTIKQNKTPGLTLDAYQQLAKPTMGYPVTSYPTVDTSIFETIVMQNMMPMHDKTTLLHSPS